MKTCKHCGKPIEKHEVLGWLHYGGVFACTIGGHSVGTFATPSSR